LRIVLNYYQVKSVLCYSSSQHIGNSVTAQHKLNESAERYLVASSGEKCPVVCGRRRALIIGICLFNHHWNQLSIIDAATLSFFQLSALSYDNQFNLSSSKVEDYKKDFTFTSTNERTFSHDNGIASANQSNNNPDIKSLEVLPGSFADGRRWFITLTKLFGFKCNEIKLMTDSVLSEQKYGRCNADRVIAALKWLVTGARPGDCLFFAFSGHGMKLQRTIEGHLVTIGGLKCLDKTIVDHWTVYDILLGPHLGIGEGVKLTMIFDTCYSGTGLCLPYQLGSAPPSNTGKKDNSSKDTDQYLMWSPKQVRISSISSSKK